MLAEARYGERHDFSPADGAEICGDWRAFGASCDWFKTDMGGFSFPLGTNAVSSLMVYSFGEARVTPRDLSLRIAPFRAPLEIAPESNWPQLTNSPSLFWQEATPTNTYLMTWLNVSLDGSREHLVSFQAELYADGCAEFRYDLSLAGCDVVTNADVALLSGTGGFCTNGIPAGLTTLRFQRLDPAGASNPDPDGDRISTDDEVFVYHTNPYCADTDYDGLTDYDELFVYNTDPLDSHSLGAVYCDGFALKLGELDPFSCLEGSTNTVLEHVFYSGTTNGAFAYPQSSAETGVLRVMVSGTGVGEMIVGDEVVPLVAPPQLRSGAVTNTLLKEIGYGVRKEVWFRKPAGLEVAIDSDVLLIGEMPTFYWAHGWLAFPHTEATVPCIHDLRAKSKRVSLVHGEEFPGLTATWTNATSGIVIVAEPPVSALITANFSPFETREMSYMVDHPKKLNSPSATFAQTLRFCPPLQDSEIPPADLNENDYDDPYYSCECVWSGNCTCCSGEWCHCQCWNCPCNANQSPTLEEDPVAADAFTNIVSGVLPQLSGTLYLYRANETVVHLDVPDGSPRHCCPCPDHWGTNHVSLVYNTSRTAVKKLNGEEFSVAYSSCDATIFGVFPSQQFGDAHVMFATNGVTSKTFDGTVLGVAFESEQGRAPMSEYNRRSVSFGYPVAISTNIEYAGSICMRTDVLLTNGFVRLSLEDVHGDIALWLPEWWDNNGAWHKEELLLQGGVVSSRHMEIGRWRNIMRRYCATRKIALKVTSSRPSKCKVRFEFASSSGSAYVHDFAEQSITTVMPALLPDYNRDGRADIKDALDQGNGRWLYFWVNNDTWRGDDAFAAYDEYNALIHPWPITLPGNGGDMVVNGRNDLVNLCPFAVNLAAFVDAWGLTDVRYELHAENPGAIRFVPVRTKWVDLGKMVTEDQKTLADEDLHSSVLQSIPGEYLADLGYDLPPDFMSLGATGSGAVAVEFASIDNARLRISVRDGTSGDLLFDSPVVYLAMDVHQMYRWLNLDYVCGEQTDAKYNDRLYAVWPDYEHADANVVFVHGYNMHPSEAWDWSQAVFKRLWWSGMDAGFTAVLWRGNQSQLWISPAKSYATINYHQNVLNAFRTASVFASRVNSLPGGKKYMIAHSLGNMLVSAARQFHGLQYEKYFMLNAAVPIEAYDQECGVTENSKFCMTHPDWRPYPDRVRATHWYELFLASQGDERRRLTWKGLFKDVGNTVNFYSSKDEVVADGNGKWKWPLTRNHAWYNQERARGAYLVSLSPQAGWKFSEHYLTNSIVENAFGEVSLETRWYTPEETALIGDNSLREHSFFKEFRDTALYGAGGSQFLAANPYVLWYALSHGIPAESFATGANPVPKWGAATQGNIMEGKNFKKGLVRNVDMAVNCVPRGRKELPWIHSYFIKNSLFDTAVLYKALVNQVGSTIPEKPVEGENSE